MNTIKLNNGVQIPLTGFGVFQILDQEQCKTSVLNALTAGYRLIDTAACYGNERAVGQAIHQSGLKRDEVFLCTKVWIQDTGYEATRKSFKKSLYNLQTDYIDLYLLHMPYGDYHGSWRAMQDLYHQGRIRAIGVCNFLPDRLVDLCLTHDIVPAINQIELHPFCQQQQLRSVMKEYNIMPMAWAPFAEGNNNIFSNKTLTSIGAAYGKTAAQVILRWLKQQEIIAIPKSSRAERIAENFALDDFALAAADMQQIAALDLGKSLILDIQSLEEVHRLHNIKFEQ